MTKRKVLVTGACGYLGSVLCEHLLKVGHSVVALDNMSHSVPSHLHLCENENYEFVYGDTRDEALLTRLLRKADIIIPLAAIVGAPACEIDPLSTSSINLGAIQSINKLRSENQLVIIPNTNSGYGSKSGDFYCDENTPLQPISLYGKTKCEAESEVLSKPNSISLRLATVFGASPRMRIDLLVNNFVWAAFKDGYLVIFEKDFKRNFVHIRDVADCFCFAIENADKMLGRAFNVGLESANLSKEQLALKIKEVLPNFYIHYSEVGSDPDKRNYIVSNERLRQVGFEAKRSIEAGIHELIKSYTMMVKSPYRNA